MDISSPLGMAWEMMGRSAAVVQRLRAAAAQQQRLNEQQRQQLFEDEMKIRQAGGVPYEPYQAGPSDASGLKTRTPNPNAGNPSNVVTMRDGRRWLMPDPKAHQGFADSMQAMEHGGEAVTPQGMVHEMGDVPRLRLDEAGGVTDTGKRGVNVPVPEAGRVVNAGQQPFYIPTNEQKAETEFRTKVRQADALRELGDMPIPPDVAGALGLTGQGGRATFRDILEAHTKLFPGEDKDTPANLHINTNDFNVPVGINPRTGEVKPLKLPAGVKPAVGPAKSQAAEQRAAAAKQKEIDAFQKQHDVLQTEEQKQHALRWAYGQGLAVGEDKPAVDPKTGKRVMMTAERRKYFQAQFDLATKQVERLQERQKAIRQRVGGGEFAPGQPEAGSTVDELVRKYGGK